MITLSGASLVRQIERIATPSLFTRFMTWAENQQENRLAWLGIALAVHGCFLTPLTVMIVMTTTYNFTLFMAGIAAMTIALVTNLAALPTKITVPAFFLSVAMDLAIIAISFSLV